MKSALFISGLLLAVLCTGKLSAQTYAPIAVSGFNHDIIAEATPNASALTDTVLDATNHIMYSQAFASAAGLGGGLPNTGFVADAANTHRYQLASYSGPNGLTLVRNRSLPLVLNTPASFSRLSLLAFATENASAVSVTVRFTDGSSTNYLTGYSLPDWFNNTTNVVISGFGRINRVTTAPYGVDGLSTNPRFYYIDFALNCSDQLKTVAQLSLSNVTTAGSNAPFPNAVFMALSGVPFTQTVAQAVTPATCSAANGTATLTVTGSAAPYTITWNTVPAQSGITATGLVAGTYTATITNVNGCAATEQVIIAQLGSTVTANASASPATICNSESTQLSVTAAGGTLSTYTWTPGNLNGATVTVSPTASTTYTVSGNDQYGCSYSKSVTVTVNDRPQAPAASAASICAGTTATLNVQSPVSGESYNWYGVATGGTTAGTGSSFQTPALSSTTTYYLEAVSAAGCVQPARTPVTVTVNPVPATPGANNTSICPGEQATLNVINPVAGETYSWYSVASGGTANASGNSYQTAPLNSTTTFYIEATSSAGCTAPSRAAVTVTVNPAPTVPAASANAICAGTAATLSVQSPVAGETYSWFAAATGGTALGTGTTYVTPVLNSSSTYYVEAVSASGCRQASRGSVTVTVNALPATPSGTAAPVCTGNSAQLQVQSPVAGETYRWFTTATGGTAAGTGNTLATPALTSSLTYYLEATSGAGCTSAGRGSVPVTVYPAPLAPTLAAVAICPGDRATLTIPSPLPGATYDWFAAPTGGTSLFTGSSYQTAAISNATTFYIGITSAQGCFSATRGAAPVALLAPLPAPVVSVSLLTSSSVTFSWNAITGATGYEVSIDGGATWRAPSTGSTGTSHSVSGLIPGAIVTIQVRALGQQPCELSAPSVPLRAIIPDKNLFVPNVFTPNGDGRNDILMVFSNSITTMNFRIYNQWGNEVFVSTDPRKGWDGTINGQPQPVGVYVYVLRVRLFDGTELQKKGSISLLR
jgi:gliding motility-associated-like protein